MLHLLFFHTREPGAYVWLMVIMEMVKEFTSGEALTVQPHKKINSSPLMHWIDPNFIG